MAPGTRCASAGEFKNGVFLWPLLMITCKFSLFLIKVYSKSENNRSQVKFILLQFSRGSSINGVVRFDLLR
jgi:hypothetical protein